MARWIAQLVGLLALSWPLTACAATPWPVTLGYSVKHGDFTVRYSYCQGWKCPTPESFGLAPKTGHGWHQLTVLHSAAGMEYYRDGLRIGLAEAQSDNLYAAALVIGWGRARYQREQLINGFKLVGMNLQGGWMADTLLLRGVHREIAAMNYPDVQREYAADSLF